jgi:hypothetical protein
MVILIPTFRVSHLCQKQKKKKEKEKKKKRKRRKKKNPKTLKP